MTPLLKKLGLAVYLLKAKGSKIESIEDVTTIPGKPFRKAKKKDVLCDLSLHVFSSEAESKAFEAGMSYINDDNIVSVGEHTNNSQWYVLLVCATDSGDCNLTVFDRRESLDDPKVETI